MRFHGNQFSKPTTPRIEAKRSDRRCNSRIIRISNKQNNICLLSLWRYRTGTLLISSSFATVFALSPWIIKSLHQVAWDNLPLSSQKLVYYRKPKHQRRRPLQIRYLKKKSEFALPQSNFIALIPSCLIRQTFFFFARARARALPVLNLNMDGGKSFYYPWSEEKERLLAVYSSTKREIRYFHVLVAQRRLRNVHDARLTLLGPTIVGNGRVISGRMANRLVSRFGTNHKRSFAWSYWLCIYTEWLSKYSILWGS